jgi:hypothetical protein
VPRIVEELLEVGFDKGGRENTHTHTHTHTEGERERDSEVVTYMQKGDSKRVSLVTWKN